MVHHLPEHVGYLMLPLLGGFAASGVLKALMNLTMPVVHTFAALSTLLVPVYVRMRKTALFNRFALLATPVVIGINMIYWALLGFFGEELMRWLYDGQYVEYAGLLWLVGAIPLRSGLGAIFRAALTALERPDRVFWAYSGSSILALTIGVMLIVVYGLEGAIVSALAQLVIEVGLLIYFFIQVRLRGHTRPRRVGVVSRPQFVPHLPSSGTVVTKE
jgi:O-antigen/teichoic acid export membrane protein